MANTLLTAQEIAMESLLRLQNNLVMRNLVFTDHSNEFANKGDTIQVKKPATFTAKDFTTAIDVQGIEESNVLVKLDTISDVSVEVTSKELSLNIQNFGETVVQPAMEALAQKIDYSLTGLYADIPYFSGTGGQVPDSLTDISNARKVLNDNKVPLGNRYAVWDTEAEAKLIVLDAIANAEKSGSTQALREANMGRVLGFDNYMSQNIRTHTAGGYTGATAPKIKTLTVAGDTIAIKSTTGTGKLVKGDIFTLAGKQYVVKADTANASTNDIDVVTVYPNVPAGIAVDTTITFQTNHVASMAFHKNAFALVNRPMALPMGGATGYVANYGGLSIRVTMGYTMGSKINTISFDILHGAKTLQPELACRVFG